MYVRVDPSRNDRESPYKTPMPAPLSEIVMAGLRIGFQRTCRVPSGKMNSLPAGLGEFPIYRVSDFARTVPQEWQEDGFFIPMYRQEAMWISFPQRHNFSSPQALMVAAGNINAITGDQIKHRNGSLDMRLNDEQNYLVIPPQPWLDGWKAEDGKVYQFVAAELGSGETVEGQLTGKETVGGIQLAVFVPKPGRNLTIASRPNEYVSAGGWNDSFNGPFVCYSAAKGAARGLEGMALTSMGLGKGGEIEQKVYPDPYGLAVWNSKPATMANVHIISSEDFRQITGRNAPATPITFEMYQKLGYPWFDLYDSKLQDTEGSGKFDKLKEVGKGKKKGGKPPIIFHQDDSDLEDFPKIEPWKPTPPFVPPIVFPPGKRPRNYDPKQPHIPEWDEPDHTPRPNGEHMVVKKDGEHVHITIYD